LPPAARTALIMLREFCTGITVSTTLWKFQIGVWAH
jgi:hypothetical protein